MITDLRQVLRLEVERDPDEGELLNLNPNPDGALGAWGYVTPVAGSSLFAVLFGGRYLAYTSPGGAASYFYTEPIAVEAGQWVTARWTAPTVDGRQVASIEWLGVDKAVLSATTPSALLDGSTTPRTYGSFQAPAGTFYCRFRLDHKTSGGGNPAAGDRIWFTNLIVTAAATSGGVDWTRVNLLPTPTADGGRGDWGSGAGDVGTSAAVTLDGRMSFLLKKTGGDGPVALVSPPITVRPGRDYALQARSRAQAHGRHFTVAVRWFKANGNEIGTVELGSTDDTSGGWTGVVGGVATAPTNAASMRLRAQYRTMDNGEIHYVNATMVEQASTVGSWFDGSTPDASGVTYGWSGTANASTSVAHGAAGDPGELVPVPYQNILGSTGGIMIDREDLNVGSMSVKLIDAVLDPTQNDLISTGKRIRLVTASDDGQGEVVFAGKILTGNVTYHLLERDENKRAEVTLSAVDPINPLASTPQREGVATIAELPHVLEGAGVPWSCNGNGNQVPTAAVVAYNDNASALDQVAVTRDSALGYAWVDRNGVLQAWDRDEIGTEVAAVLDETTYTPDIDIDFDPGRIINSVTVKVLRTIATTGATEEVPFGPYVDQTSYRKNGEHAQEFTIQGVDVSDVAAIQDYAQQILDANAQPRIRVNSLVMPIRSTDDLPRALLDLYDLVTVQNERAGFDEDVRLTTIQHEITATSSGAKWLVTAGFSADGSVAPSVAVPAPPPSVGQVLDDVIQPGIDQSLQDAANALNLAAAQQQIYRQPAMPTGGSYVVGNIWFDEDDDDKQYRWNGSAWVESTGAWLVTNPSSQFPNMVISPAGLAGYDGSGSVKVSISSTTGQLVTNGSIFTSADISGSTVTGGTVQSEATANRGVKFNSSGLVAYNASGTPTFIITGSTGAVTMKGDLTSGSTLAGAAVTGSTFSTGGSIPITIAGAGIGWTSGAAITETGTNLTIQRGSSAITLSSSGIGMFGSVDASGSFSGSHSGSHSGSWSGGLTASGAVHGSTIFADSVPTTGAAINAVMGGSGQFLMNTSSQRYKYDIETADLDPAAVLALRPTTHRRFDDPEYDEDNPEAGPLYLSPIAEEVAEVSEWMVTRDSDGEPNGLNWQAITLHLIETVKDLASQIEELKAP